MKDNAGLLVKLREIRGSAIALLGNCVVRMLENLIVRCKNMRPWSSNSMKLIVDFIPKSTYRCEDSLPSR